MSLLKNISSPEYVKKLNTSQLQQLCGEIRDFLIQNVMRCGGHLASNLGAVEMIVAACLNFDFPRDKIIFDVGHQCYVYKMLTGRMNGFSALRHIGGVSGFPRTSESEYDFFDVGHAGTSISVAVGMARARDLNGGDEHIIALVGDGALTNGMNFEALNDVGLKKTKLIIILNDNEMSIDKNVGGLSAHLSRLRFNPRYINTKSSIQGFLELFGKAGKFAENRLRKVKEKLKYATVAAPLFELLGISYMGIIDGNNLEQVCAALKRAKQIDGPVVVHVSSKKGLGYSDAEKHPDKYHGISGSAFQKKSSDIGYDAVFSSVINNMASKNAKIVAITAAMTSGCGLNEFCKNYPQRFFDVGIAEEHAVTMAAGMAKYGCIPVVCMYSTFLQRAYDQIIHDVCLQKLHVVFAIGHAGATGEDGETHQGLLDLSMATHMDAMTILAPSTCDEFVAMLDYAVNSVSGPVIVRYPKAEVSRRKQEKIFPTKPEVITKGNDVLILSCGRMAECAVETAEMLKKEGISTSVINVRCIKPVDDNFINEELKGKKLLVTIEDNIVSGGMGEHLSSVLGCKIPVLHLGFDTPFVTHARQEEQFIMHKLDTESVFERISTFYKGMT